MSTVTDQEAALLEKRDMDEPVVQNPPSYTATPQVAIVKGGEMATRNMPTDPSLNTIYLAVFSMLFCLWPCGLVGLVIGIQSMQEYYRGQYEESVRSEKKAKKWVMCSIISGIILFVSIFFGVILIQAVVYGVVFTVGANNNKASPTGPTG